MMIEVINKAVTEKLKIELRIRKFPSLMTMSAFVT